MMHPRDVSLLALSGSTLAPVPANSGQKRRRFAWFCAPGVFAFYAKNERSRCRYRARRGDEMSRKMMQITRSTRRKCRAWSAQHPRETRAQIAAKLWPSRRTS